MPKLTARQRMLAEPGSVREVLKAYMVKTSIDRLIPITGMDDATLEALCEEALVWWADVMKDVLSLGGSAEAAADQLVEGMRKQEVWGKILRGSAS